MTKIELAACVAIMIALALIYNFVSSESAKIRTCQTHGGTYYVGQHGSRGFCVAKGAMLA